MIACEIVLLSVEGEMGIDRRDLLHAHLLSLTRSVTHTHAHTREEDGKQLTRQCTKELRSHSTKAVVPSTCHRATSMIDRLVPLLDLSPSLQVAASLAPLKKTTPKLLRSTNHSQSINPQSISQWILRLRQRVTLLNGSVYLSEPISSNLSLSSD